MLKTHVKKAYILILCIAFFVAILVSFLQVQNQPTTYEEKIADGHGMLPSLTICRNQVTFSDNYDTFEDVMKMIKDFENDVQVVIRNVTIDLSLKDEYVLRSLGTSLDQVWSFSATIFQDEFPTIIPCATMNLEFLEFPSDNELLLDFHNIWLNISAYRNYLNSGIGADGFYLEKHALGQSFHNFGFKWGNMLDLVYMEKGYTQVLVTVETTKLNLRSYDCDEDNAINITDCINDFINEELKCQLPWLKETSSIDLELCTGSEKLKEYRKIYTHLTSTSTIERIRKKGCLRPNCKTKSWEKSYSDVYDFDINNGTIIWFGLPYNTYTIHRKEILLADFSTFMADCGSYLGLFLGASVLSLTDLAIIYTKKLIHIARRILNKGQVSNTDILHVTVAEDNEQLIEIIKKISERLEKLEENQ